MSKNQKNDRKVKMNEEVKQFVKASFKKYYKEYAYTDDKDEAKKQYYDYLIDLLPDAVRFVVRFGHIQDDKIQEAKTDIYKKLSDQKFVKRLAKAVKNDKVEGISLLPIVIRDMMSSVKKANDEILAENPNGQIYDITDLVDLCKLVLKKKLKRASKNGIDVPLAFDLLCIIPDKEAIEISRFYRVRAFYECLYEHAKTESVPFKEVMDNLVSEDFHEVFITFALLERKERFSKLTDKQKKLYLKISTWCFEVLNEKSAHDIERILNVYVNSRRRDESSGKDGDRRYALNMVSENEYKKVAKVVHTMISQAPQLEKYLS